MRGPAFLKRGGAETQRTPRNSIRVGFVVGLLLATLPAAWWFAAHGKQRGGVDDHVDADAVGQSTTKANRPAATPPAASDDPGPARQAAPDDDNLRPPMLALSSTPPAWERQLADAAARSRDGTATARALLGLLPTLPEEALATAAEQAIEHLPDRDYAAVVQPILVNPRTHGQAMGVLFADLMERPDAVALPALFTIASDPEHPFSEPALDNLRLLLRADFGKDWPGWKGAIDQKLRP